MQGTATRNLFPCSLRGRCSVHLSCEPLVRVRPRATFPPRVGQEEAEGLLLERGALPDTCPSLGARQDLASLPATLRQVHGLPPAPPDALLHLHVEDGFLVPVLPAVPDCQGVVAPLQVELLKGQLDHLGREHRIRERAGAAGRDFWSLEARKKFPCSVPTPRVPETPRYTAPNPH